MSGLLLVYDIRNKVPVTPRKLRKQLIADITAKLETHPGLKEQSGKLRASRVCYIYRGKLYAGYDIVYGAIHELSGWAGRDHKVFIKARRPISRSVEPFLKPEWEVGKPKRKFI